MLSHFINNPIKRLLVGSLFLFFSSVPAYGTEYTQAEAKAIHNEVVRADHYLKNFEAEIERLHGSTATGFRNKNETLKRVKSLVERYPNHPEVKELFRRTKTAIMKSKGGYMEITPEMLSYKIKEENNRKIIIKMSMDEWQKKLDKLTADQMLINPVFPVPDPKEISTKDLQGKYVLIEDVRYPEDQFLGLSGEYVFSGSQTKGYWFIDISGRQWLGPYEAVKRYRRLVDAGLEDVKKWQVLGKITSVVSEVPQAEEKKTLAPQWGWVVSPVALYVPNKVVGVYSQQHEKAGFFPGEDELDAIKEASYSITSLAKDASPSEVMTAFYTAIKEKNFKLFLQCIEPGETDESRGVSLVNYHWDLHQHRFNKLYVAATFDKPVIRVTKGYDGESNNEDFFLDDTQREQIKKMSGEKVQMAYIKAKAWDKNGKQYGSPVTFILEKKGSGSWHLINFSQPF